MREPVTESRHTLELYSWLFVGSTSQQGMLARRIRYLNTEHFAKMSVSAVGTQIRRCIVI